MTIEEFITVLRTTKITQCKGAFIRSDGHCCVVGLINITLQPGLRCLSDRKSTTALQSMILESELVLRLNNNLMRLNDEYGWSFERFANELEAASEPV